MAILMILSAWVTMYGSSVSRAVVMSHNVRDSTPGSSWPHGKASLDKRYIYVWETFSPSGSIKLLLLLLFYIYNSIQFRHNWNLNLKLQLVIKKIYLIKICCLSITELQRGIHQWSQSHSKQNCHHFRAMQTYSLLVFEWGLHIYQIRGFQLFVFD